MAEGLVALHVDVDIRSQGAGDFPYPIGTGLAVWGSHKNLSSESSHGIRDASVIRGHHDIVQTFRTGYQFIDMLNHWFTADISQWFSWKAR